MDVTVNVRGDPKTVWDGLITMLAAKQYRIEKLNPHTSFVAKRGSKATSLVVDKKDIGFRELHVEILPQGSDASQVRLEFKFPVWEIPLPAAKKELAQLGDELVSQLGAGAPSAGPQAAGVVCAKCKANNRPGAAFCEKCGTKLEPQGPRSCPKCKAALAADAKFCSKCGTKVG
jgi:ribosomal protein L40E